MKESTRGLGRAACHVPAGSKAVVYGAHKDMRYTSGSCCKVLVVIVKVRLSAVGWLLD